MNFVERKRESKRRRIAHNYGLDISQFDLNRHGLFLLLSTSNKKPAYTVSVDHNLACSISVEANNHKGKRIMLGDSISLKPEDNLMVSYVLYTIFELFDNLSKSWTK